MTNIIRKVVLPKDDSHPAAIIIKVPDRNTWKVYYKDRGIDYVYCWIRYKKDEKVFHVKFKKPRLLKGYLLWMLSSASEVLFKTGLKSLKYVAEQLGFESLSKSGIKVELDYWELI